jgi:hypothetical protein
VFIFKELVDKSTSSTEKEIVAQNQTRQIVGFKYFITPMNSRQGVGRSVLANAKWCRLRKAEKCVATRALILLYIEEAAVTT